MTLEDFFTLTEMKDGLTAPARVEELVSVMQKEKNGVVKNVGDTTRHWGAVASAITATENKECLDLFIQLDGLWFIDRWLKDAQTFADDTSACFVEEAISALLLAVEKLQIDNERLHSSGICSTVEGLLNYNSTKVQDKARALFNNWKAKEVDISRMDVDKATVSEETSLISEDLQSRSVKKDASPTGTPVDQISEGVDGQNPQLSTGQDGFEIAPDPSKTKGLPGSLVSPMRVDSVGGDLSVKEPSGSSDGKLDQKLPAAPEQDTNDVISEKCNPLVESARHDKNVGICPDSVGKTEVSLSSAADGGNISSRIAAAADGRDISPRTAAADGGDISPKTAAADGGDISPKTAVEGDILSRTAASAVEEPVNQPAAGRDDGNERLVAKSTSSHETNVPAGDVTNEMDASISLEPKSVDQNVGSSLVETKNPQTVSNLEAVRKEDEVKQHRKSKKKHFGKSSKFSRLTKNRKNPDIIRQKADMDLEDGTFDALEVACLVANEVAREIVDYEEQSDSSSSSSSSSSTSSSSSSSSEKISSGGLRQLERLGSANGGGAPQIKGPINEAQRTGELSLEASEKMPLNSSATIETNLENHVQDMELPQVTDVAREPESNTKKGLFEFDLNQEFSTEDVDQNQADTASNPVSVVSASRAVVSLGMPAGPLKFEGSLGWKGSAATSAFRPASPRRASDSDRALSGGGTSSGSRQRQDFLDIDLNIAEGGEDKMAHLMSAKQRQLLPGLPSGESSVELSPKRWERLKFDLNQIEEDGSVPVSQWKIGGCLFGPQKSRRSPSPASSSSCMQSATRNFDLNDNPFNGNDPPDLNSFLGESSSNKVNPYAAQQDDSVISILGTKVTKSTFPTQNSLPFPNGKASESVIDASLFRGGPFMGLGPAVPYPQPVYGYNGLAMGPATPFSAPIYGSSGPIPYMLDTRGAPFVPQMMGAPSAAPPSYGQPPSLVMNMMGGTPAPNVAGPLSPNVDLNSGYALEMGNRDPAFFRQLFIPGQGRPLDDQVRDNFRPLSSGASGGKRKEPDSGWELYPTNYEHHQPPHL